MAALDRLQTAVRADRLDLARTWLGELEAFAAGTGAASPVAVVEHGRALLAADGNAEEHFRRALKAHTGSARLPDRARTELAFGEYLGAAPWAARTAVELRAKRVQPARRRVPRRAHRPPAGPVIPGAACRSPQSLF